VYAATRAEKNGWIEAINKATAKLLEKPGKTACRDFAPVMTPNSSVSSCMSCHIEFGLMVRRHHCKRCGRVVCSSCAGNKLILPSRPDKHLRVCLSCFTVLLEIKKERASGVKKQAENVSEKMTDDDKDGDEKQSRAMNPKLYQLAEAGLWWDSFEEDPQFDICDDFDEQLTLDEETSFSVESCDDDRSDMEESDDDKREQNQAQVPQA